MEKHLLLFTALVIMDFFSCSAGQDRHECAHNPSFFTLDECADNKCPAVDDQYITYQCKHECWVVPHAIDEKTYVVMRVLEDSSAGQKETFIKYSHVLGKNWGNPTSITPEKYKQCKKSAYIKEYIKEEYTAKLTSGRTVQACRTHDSIPKCESSWTCSKINPQDINHTAIFLVLQAAYIQQKKFRASQDIRAPQHNKKIFL